MKSDGSLFKATYKPANIEINTGALGSGSIGWQPIVTTERDVFFAIETALDHGPGPQGPIQNAPTTMASVAPIPCPSIPPALNNDNSFLKLINKLANEPSPRIILKQVLVENYLSSYFVCLPRSVTPPKHLITFQVPYCPPDLNIVRFKASRMEFKFMYNYLTKANTAIPSGWLKSPKGQWQLLAWRLADQTYARLVELILSK